MKLRIAFAALIASTLMTVTAAQAYKPVAGPAPIPYRFGTGGGFGATPWILMSCPAGVVFAAVFINATQNRELSAREAWSCGLLAWFSQPQRRNLRVVP